MLALQLLTKFTANQRYSHQPASITRRLKTVMRNRFPWFLILSILFFMKLADAAENEEPEGIEDMEGDAEKLYNKTYIETMTLLDETILKGYNRRSRPVRNASTPVEVRVHYHVVHLSIDQKMQTMSVFGHIYMTWPDEYLVWNVADFNGLRVTRVRKWQIWNPTLRVANSVSGASELRDISRMAQVLVTSRTANVSMVEVYPTMSIKVGCNFDYSDYPYDEHNCTVRLYTPEKTNRVQLKYYGDLPSTLLLGWGSQSAKKIISDFEVTGCTNQVLYARFDTSQNNTIFSTTPPVTAEDLATTISGLETTLHFRRHPVYFSVGFFLPCILVVTLTSLSYLLPSSNHALFIFVSTFIVQGIFLQELVQQMPPSSTGVPKCIVFYTFSTVWNFLNVGIHIFVRAFSTSKEAVPAFLVTVYNTRPSLIKKGCDEDEVRVSWQSALPYLRALFAVFNLILYTCLIIYFFFI